MPVRRYKNPVTHIFRYEDRNLTKLKGQIKKQLAMPADVWDVPARPALANCLAELLLDLYCADAVVESFSIAKKPESCLLRRKRFLNYLPNGLRLMQPTHCDYKCGLLSAISATHDPQVAAPFHWQAANIPLS